MRKKDAFCHDDITTAGAMLGAPSREKPCNMPFAKMAPLDRTFFSSCPPPDDDDEEASCDSSSFSMLSLMPNNPMNTKLAPTVDSAMFVHFSMLTNRAESWSFNKNAHRPKIVADSPWPKPQIAPIFAPYQPDFPTLLGSKAARWSGPAEHDDVSQQ